MANKNSDHDKLFKITMAKPETVKEFLENYLPKEIKSVVNLKTLQLQKDSFIDNNLKGHYTDLLYSVDFHKTRGYIYILFEHLSNPDKMAAFRLWKYATHVMENHLKQNRKNKLPLIYPIVIYTGTKNYSSSESIFDLFENKELAKKIFLGPYKLINLQNISDEELQNQIRFGLMAKIFKNMLLDPLIIIEKIKPNLMQIDNEGDVNLICGVIKYFINTKEIHDKEQFFDGVASTLSEETGDKIMTLAEVLRQEGFEQGYQKGKTLAETLKQEGFEQGFKKGKTLAETLKQEGFEQGYQKGKTLAEKSLRQEAKDNTLKMVASNLLASNLSLSQIAKATGLSINEIKKLTKSQQ